MTYDDLVSGGTAAVAALVGKQETLSLEFKSNNPREPIFDSGELTNPGKKILAKACSAFANSAGGVLVFGVLAVNRDGVDQATELTPIANVRRAETSVRDAAADLLQPRHDGIRVASVPTSPDADEGFIVVDVPRSERRPHRSEARGQKEYFKRIGGRSYPMEHYDIEDAFKRFASPALELLVRLVTTPYIEGVTSNRLELALQNDGDATAKHITLQIWNTFHRAFSDDRDRRMQAVRSEYNSRILLSAPADFVVHPGQVRLFHNFAFSVADRDGEMFLENSPISAGPISFQYSIGADYLRIVEKRFEASADQMAGLKPITAR